MISKTGYSLHNPPSRKPYFQYPLKHEKQLQSAQNKQRHTLEEIYRRTDVSFHTRAKTKLQQSKIQNWKQSRTHKTRILPQTNTNDEKNLKAWYLERVKELQKYYTEFMRKLQKQFGEKEYKRQERQALLCQMNTLWEERVPLKLKRCFQS